ncbi:hypothetical protein ACKI1I_39475 [Streptomyces turgidiscabies]|uniref:Uncharacterized protein n=1 Tax=Streptomyces turgidiscabies (strain Car8) TaxID=698760 RepID=L7F4M1_STRT8|nr:MULTISPECIES: hypothetical protein [Streptomyces]ELP65565.1 hypothetical protein STRTUCAR8_04152 [Streptomyces turgidiscabies Car8]MDX3497591.1 hypothetical protein [Streptomyces turgidiscabies]GAQ76117.1 hypothetical protein T45_07906 [Streptomyces turgidiscabies]
MLLTPSGRRSRYAAVLALTLALVAGVTAWAFTDRSPAAAPPAGRATTSPAELSERLPFYALLQDREGTQRNIVLAQRKLTVACMAKRGFTYRPVAMVSAAATAGEHATPFGPESLADLTPAEPQAPPSEKPESQAFTRALFGDSENRISAKGKLVTVTRPADGCQAEAEKHLLGDQRVRWLELRIQLGEGDKEARQQLEKDPAFRAANARWSTCMRAAGSDAKDPTSLLYGLPRGTDLAKSPAVRADVRCKDETDYLSTAYTRLRAVQQTWLNRHTEALTAWNALQRSQGEIAGEVLGLR